MSIYWAPADDEPLHAGSDVSRALTRDVAALIYEHHIPWDASALRALARRIWAGARGPHGPYQPAATQTVTDFGPDNRPD